ncbi:MAG: OmpA family protein [Legionellales bacterium]|nr:OmpA family protein [Legionellales bacterium]
MQKKVFIVSYCIILITGCSSTANKPYVDSAVQQSTVGVGAGAAFAATGVGILPSILVGTVLGPVIGHNIQSNESKYLQLVDKLNSHHVKIVQEGDEIRFILPADRFFYGGSPNLLDKQIATFSILSDLINSLPATIIRVAGYSDNLGSRERNVALANARAEAVIKHINPLDTRLIWAENGKELLPVEYDKNMPIFENSSNRVEIVLEPVEHLGIG